MFKHVSHHFSRAVANYDKEANVQQQVGMMLVNMLLASDFMPKRMIDLGCGTGLTSEVLAKQTHYQVFHAIDVAQGFLCLAERRLAPYHIQVYQQDFHHFQNQFDLIFSNMALHWSHDLIALFKHCHQQLSADGCFVFSLPLANSFKNLQGCHKHDFKSLAIIQRVLVEAGFYLITCKQQSFLLEFPSVLMAMKAIKRIGANETAAPRKSLLGKSYLQNIIQQSPKTAQNTFHLNYEIGYFMARPA